MVEETPLQPPSLSCEGEERMVKRDRGEDERREHREGEGHKKGGNDRGRRG